MFKFISFLFFSLLYLISSAQFTHDGRGMYVDNFFRWTYDPGGIQIVDPNYSILSIASKEDSLLRFANNNHITYLALYDLYQVLGNPAYEDYLCNFIEKAKTHYCIEKIGVPSSCAAMFSSIYSVTATAPINLNSPNPSSKNNSISDLMNTVQNIYKPSDSLFYISEVLKLNLRAAAFNDDCDYKVDVLVTEYEFWNAGNDNCLEIPMTMAGKYLNYQNMILCMDSIRDNYNNSHSDHQIYVETYLGYLDTNVSVIDPYYIYNTYHQSYANWIDGMNNGKRRVDRINAHYYGANPTTLYGRSNSGVADTGYYLYRFLDFCQPGTNDTTNLHPILSAENKSLGAVNNFLGPWFSQSIKNNIFKAEKIWFNDWYNDSMTFHLGTVGDTTYGNVITPGGVQWFTSSQMLEPLKNPVLFTSNSPVCVALGQTGTFQFEYQGPIEQGYKYRFYITLAGSSIIFCGSSNFADWPVYNRSTQTSINLNSSLNGCSFPKNDYDAHLELIYSSGCDTILVPPVRVSVLDTAKIVALTPTTVCKGTPVYLQASSTGSGGTTSYAWYVDNNPLVNETTSTYAADPSLSGSHDYSCLITSSINGCSKNKSNKISVKFNPMPATTISIQNYNGCAITLNAIPSGGTYLWHDSSTSSTYSTIWSGRYSVAVTVNGCTGTASRTFTKSQIDFVSKTINCPGNSTGSITVNISGESPPYSMSWTGPVSGGASQLSAGNKVIPNLRVGTYTITVTDAHGCSQTLIPNVAIDSCPVTLNMKMYIQGFYSGGGLMEGASGKGCLNILDPIIHPDPTDADFVTITAMNSTSYLPVESHIGLLKTNGELNVIFTGPARIGNRYYLQVTHRNLVETWSKNPVLFTSSTSYDFTTASTQAFDDGLNIPMIQISGSPVRWAMFNGDINQDGGVDALDMIYEEDDSIIGAFGYNATDLNGDGGSDALDMTIIENNGIVGVFEAHP